jgi:hypothetical protein
MPLGATGAAIGGGLSAVGGIAGAIGANSAYNDKQNAYNALLQSAGANPAGIFGTTPEYTPVDYSPLYESDPGYAGLVGDALKGNLRNLPLATNLSSQINSATTKDAMTRVNSWDPSFMASLDQLYSNTNSALQGRLPYQDALQIAGGQGQLSNTLGNAGGSAPQTAADLGQMRSTLMNSTGPNLLGQITSILGQVDPTSSHTTASSFLLNPSQVVQSAVGENEFGANFNMQQNLQEAAFGAMPDPQAQGLFNLQALQAGMAGQYNPSASMALSSLGSAFSNPFINGMAGQNPQFAQYYNPTTGTYQPYLGGTQFTGNNGYVSGGRSISTRPY